MSKTTPKILLIYPPNQLLPIEIPRPDGSLGLLYLAGALRQYGIEVEILDASVGSKNDTLRETFFRRRIQHNGLTRIGMTKSRLREYIKSENYDIVGISSNFTPQTKMALEVARLAKEANPKIFVAAGGVNARALSRRFLESGFVDVVAMSEAEKTIIKIVTAWQKGQKFNINTPPAN